MGSDEPWEPHRSDGQFVTLIAVEYDDGRSSLWAADDDDMDYMLDEGKPYEYYVRWMSDLAFVPCRVDPGEECPVTGERDWKFVDKPA